MDKKPLILVSICAVVLLVLGSLSNVVGYQSVKSTAVNDSPLFQTRTQRATNQQQNAIISNYVGKGIHTIPFPIKNNKTTLLQKIIEMIQNMDEDTFKKFIKSLNTHIQQNKDMVNIGLNNEEIIDLLYAFRENPDIIDGYNLNTKGILPPFPTINYFYLCTFVIIIVTIIEIITFVIFSPIWILTLIYQIIVEIYQAICENPNFGPTMSP